MDERELLIMLYDYYGELFTDIQRKYFEWYFFDNLSLGEIAELTGKSRNAIHTMIKRVSDKLIEYENILKLYDKNIRLENIINKIDDINLKNELEALL